MALLSMDSKFMKFMDQFVDLVWLNLLWLLASLPLVTFGAATAAASRVLWEILEGESPSIARRFFWAFKDNLRRGIPLGLLTLAVGAALGVDARLLAAGDPPALVIGLGVALGFLAFLALIYAYPLTARYENTVLRTLQNSFLLALRHFGKTLVVALLVALELGLFFWNTTMLFFGLIFGPMVLLMTVTAFARTVVRG